jgi:GT2 family glycosyltransferase
MKKKTSRIFVILLNWNGKKDTLECLASLQAVQAPSFYTVIVDNGSTDGSVETFRKAYPQIPIIETGANLGFAGGNNVAIEWALKKGAEWIFLLNNDTLVDPSILKAFLAAANTPHLPKILGAKIYRYNDPQRIDHLGGRWNPQIAEFESCFSGELDDGISYETMQKVDYACGAALWIHRSVFESIGLLEPHFFLFWEETDFCMRARRKGFEVWTAPQAKIWHKVSSSFTGGKPQMHYFWWRSRLLWIERNCTALEKRDLYRKVITPELWKLARHCLLKSLQSLFSKNPLTKQKALRLKAGCLGAFHYWIRRFGNSPSWLSKKRSFNISD